MIIKNIIICEDIRQEVGNKFSLMGVLGSTININASLNLPKESYPVLSLASLVSMENDNPENNPKDFNVEISMSIGENKIGKMTARVMSTGTAIDRILHLPVPKFDLTVNETTRFSIHAQIVLNDTVVSENKTVLDINLVNNSIQEVSDPQPVR